MRSRDRETLISTDRSNDSNNFLFSNGICAASSNVRRFSPTLLRVFAPFAKTNYPKYKKFVNKTRAAPTIVTQSTHVEVRVPGNHHQLQRCNESQRYGIFVHVIRVVDNRRPKNWARVRLIRSVMIIIRRLISTASLQ